MDEPARNAVELTRNSRRLTQPCSWGLKLPFQLPENVAGEALVDLPMPGHRLACSCPGVLIPIMPAPVPKQDAPIRLQSLDQVFSLHAIRNFATRRTPGIWPLVNSS